jgi:DNA-binding transcriptional ArsR family regulator
VPRSKSPAPSPAERELAELEAVFSALAHPARRQILLAVHFRGEPMTAGDIAGRFHHAWPTTTRHIRVLEAAGLLVQEKQGRNRFYRVDRTRLKVITDWARWFDEDRRALKRRARG